MAVLQFGDDVLWGGTFPLLAQAVFCDFGGEWGGEKEKLLCCSPADKNKHCHALPAKPKQVKVWNRLCSGVRALCGTGDPITRGIYSLPGCGSCYCGVFSVFL